MMKIKRRKEDVWHFILLIEIVFILISHFQLKAFKHIHIEEIMYTSVSLKGL